MSVSETQCQILESGWGAGTVACSTNYWSKCASFSTSYWWELCMCDRNGWHLVESDQECRHQLLGQEGHSTPSQRGGCGVSSQTSYWRSLARVRWVWGSALVVGTGHCMPSASSWEGDESLYLPQTWYAQGVCVYLQVLCCLSCIRILKKICFFVTDVCSRTIWIPNRKTNTFSGITAYAT